MALIKCPDCGKKIKIMGDYEKEIEFKITGTHL